MTSVCYLEVDDEITSAIARLRNLADDEAVIVVPPGSRVATSRINFKLLAREAAERHMNIVAVSDEPGVRALAISAGLPAYDTLPAAEGALASFREQDRRMAGRLGPTAGSEAMIGTRALPPAQLPLPIPDAAPGLDSTDTAIMPPPAARPRRRQQRLSVAPVLVLLFVAILVAGVAYGAFIFLPTATITLHPATIQISQGTFTVIADPNVAVADPVAGVIPAQRVEVPVSASDDFPATGSQVTQTPAHGTVRFRSENTVNAVTVSRGTLVSTPDGVDFATTDDATVPKADFGTGTPGTVDVDVKAAVAGPRGNVDANAISVVSSALSSQLISVRNIDPTTGGRRVETAIVSQSDYDSAVTALTAKLSDALTQMLADSQNVPRGLTAYPQTAVLGPPQAAPPPTAVVGTGATSFTLAVNALATVVAVNESLIADVATTRIQGSVAPGQSILGEVQSSHDVGAVAGQTITYQVSASASAYTMPDSTSLVAAVRGKSVTEARQILAQYGTVDVTTWPEFVDHLPDQPARISLTVVAPSPGA